MYYKHHIANASQIHPENTGVVPLYLCRRACVVQWIYALMHEKSNFMVRDRPLMDGQ